MTVYYHVSTDIKHSGVFEPRIPNYRHKVQEDAQTPRISVAPTLEDCFTAIPNGGGSLDVLNMEQRGYYLIFRIDTEKLGIPDDQIVPSKILYEKDLVRDADVTNEVWITYEFTVPDEDQFLIKVNEWNEEVHDILPFSIHELADKKYQGNYLEAYEDAYNRMVPCSIGIKNLDYTHENVQKGEEVALNFDWEDEKEELINYLRQQADLEVTEFGIDTVTIVMKEDSNLNHVFLHHKELKDLY